jgi:hypothetical protein
MLSHSLAACVLVVFVHVLSCLVRRSLDRLIFMKDIHELRMQGRLPLDRPRGYRMSDLHPLAILIKLLEAVDKAFQQGMRMAQAVLALHICMTLLQMFAAANLLFEWVYDVFADMTGSMLMVCV